MQSAAGGGTQPVDEHGNTLLHLAVQHAGCAEIAFLAKHKNLCTQKNAAGDLPVCILLSLCISAPDFIYSAVLCTVWQRFSPPHLAVLGFRFKLLQFIACNNDISIGSM